eukprot:CAMPEP_0206143600 /NCGR_PEP_ID=MMETSP1473-20131121/21134_1 /ASSEMBLY_ACC=CAM_ASM_001109 /TAXON_ID=1461547 /ORGANISM="Stichococcus sp, Strain RCC1054" /LENGTH=225 /DNA_ID=CAMNT_0053539077 /DNA_START=202 /DNA_END=879 /DNA_ORIENTATION=+
MESGTASSSAQDMTSARQQHVDQASCRPSGSSPEQQDQQSSTASVPARERDSVSDTRKQTVPQVTYRGYQGEADLEHVMRLIDSELSEPYSVFTYRYFLKQWPNLCIFACDDSGAPVATIVGKAEAHKSSQIMRGYIAMLVVDTRFRGAGIGTELVRRVLHHMKDAKAEEVALEAETTNWGALLMYETLGFVRDKRLERYYLSGTDAFRLKLLLPPAEQLEAAAS